MMKKLILLPALLLAFGAAFAQKVEKKDVRVASLVIPGFTVTIEKNIDLVEDALEERLDKADLKIKKVEGFLAALNQHFDEIYADPVNFYIKLEKDSKKKTVVTACVIPTDLTVKQEKIQDNLRLFLAGFVKDVERFEARGHMETQQGYLKKAQKAHASAVGTVEKLDKNIQKDEDKIADKKKQIEKYKERIAELQDEIKKLEANVSKSKDKKNDAQKDVEAAHDNVKSVQGEVDKYRSLSE